MDMSLKKPSKYLFKETLYHTLVRECRFIAPGARLSESLRNRLEQHPFEVRQEIVCMRLERCPPLFLASKRGNVEVVEYLIEMCGADVEQCGDYEVPDDKSVHTASPLWCAAVMGHLPVVKCLVSHNANVNSASNTGSTPVRSACYMTHHHVVLYLVEHGADILKPNFNGGNCLINSVQSVQLCKFLLDHGALVNAQDIQNKTALHYAVQEQRLSTCKLLLSRGADAFIKSNNSDDALQSACLKGAMDVFDHLIENVPYTLKRQCDAYELMGATYLDEHQDLGKAISLWRRAMQLRESHSECKKEVLDANPVYENLVEFTTMEQLENYISQPNCLRNMSLIICERILGASHKDTIFRLMYRGASYADMFHYQRCIDLWIYALKRRLDMETLLHSETCFTAQALVRLYVDLCQKYAEGQVQEIVRFSDFYDTISTITLRVPEAMDLLLPKPVFQKQVHTFHRICKIILNLLYVYIYIEKTPQEEMQLKRLVNQLLRHEPRTEMGDTLLHLSVGSETTISASLEVDNFAVFPSAQVTSLLLECGANPNARNKAHSTPLHTAVKHENYNSTVVQILLDRGAHIDSQNDKGIRPSYVLKSKVDCNVNPLQYMKLTCLAAQVIKDNSIQWWDTDIPSTLHRFMQLH